jgi:hypothetical protein
MRCETTGKIDRDIVTMLVEEHLFLTRDGVDSFL